MPTREDRPRIAAARRVSAESHLQRVLDRVAAAATQSVAEPSQCRLAGMRLDMVTAADPALVPDLPHVAFGNRIGLLHWTLAMTATHTRNLQKY